MHLVIRPIARESIKEVVRLDARQRANADWKQRLDRYEPPPLPDAVDAELTDFIDRHHAAEPDAWY